MSRSALEDAANDVAVGLDAENGATNEASRVDAGNSLHASRSNDDVVEAVFLAKQERACKRVGQVVMHPGDAHLDRPPVRVVHGDSAGGGALHEGQQAPGCSIARDDPAAGTRAFGVTSAFP